MQSKDEGNTYCDANLCFFMLLQTRCNSLYQLKKLSTNGLKTVSRYRFICITM